RLRSRNSSEARHEPGRVIMSKLESRSREPEGTKESGGGRGRTGGGGGWGGDRPTGRGRDAPGLLGSLEPLHGWNAHEGVFDGSLTQIGEVRPKFCPKTAPHGLAASDHPNDSTSRCSSGR